MEHVFIKSIITEHVKLRPHELGSNFEDVILQKLRNECEGRCTRHGYIREGSVRLYKVSPGRVETVTLNGDITFTVMYQSEVCNPAIGAVVTARVTNVNKFGILAHCGLADPDTAVFVPVLEIVIAKQGFTLQSEVNLDRVRVGDSLDVEILGKKFELYDTRITIVGRAASHDMLSRSVAGTSAAAATASLLHLADADEEAAAAEDDGDAMGDAYQGDDDADEDELADEDGASGDESDYGANGGGGSDDNDSSLNFIDSDVGSGLGCDAGDGNYGDSESGEDDADSAADDACSELAG